MVYSFVVKIINPGQFVKFEYLVWNKISESYEFLPTTGTIVNSFGHMGHLHYVVRLTDVKSVTIETGQEQTQSLVCVAYERIIL